MLCRSNVFDRKTWNHYLYISLPNDKISTKQFEFQMSVGKMFSDQKTQKRNFCFSQQNYFKTCQSRSNFEAIIGNFLFFF
jgi:major membrane immunogen (membrane-anchored lipoprotein)